MSEFTENPDGGLIAASSSAVVAVVYNEYGTPSYAGIWSEGPYFVNQVVVDPNNYWVYICIETFFNDLEISPSDYISLYGEQRWQFYSDDPIATVSYFSSLPKNVLSGLSEIDLDYFSQEGCAFVSGEADISVDSESIIQSVGVKTSSSAIVSVVRNPQISGGSRGSGTSVFRVRFFVVVTSGCSIAGQSLVDYTLLTLGGIRTSGSSLNQIEANPFIVSSGVRCLGTNLLLINNNFFYQTQGREVFLGGNFDFGIKNAKFIATGGVQLVSQGSDNFEFFKVVSFKWKRNAYISKKIDFNWNLGQLTMYWYRVIGKGVQDPCIGDPCCQKIVMNVHARSLAELCKKLSKRRYKFPIDTVQRFRIPAETDVINELEAAGDLLNCNDLIDVEVCSVPECAEFCIDQDLLVRVVADMQVYLVQQIVASGGSQLSGIAFLDVIPPAKPNTPYTSVGGVELIGESDYSTNSFVGRGGAIGSGVARLRHSKWRYTGGNWPNATGVKFGSIAASSPRNKNQSSWLLPERVLKQDLLYSTADISYGKTSQFLVVKNFNFNLPINCKILSLILKINCFATQVGVRDNDLYLILGDTIISNNLASKNVDWPLLQTTRQYGLNGWKDTETVYNELPSISALTTSFYENDKLPSREDLSDPDFGIALSVKASNSVAATLARVEYVTFEITYEDPLNSIIRVTSDSGLTAKSPSYSATSDGRIRLSGDYSYNQTRFFTIKIASKGILIQPNALRSVTVSVNGGMNIGGESKVTPYFEKSTGGATLGSEAEVLPWWVTMYGTANLSGTASVGRDFYYSAQGNVNIEGFAFTPENRFDYGAAGGVQISGNSFIKNRFWKFNSDGNVLFVLGEALGIPGNITLPKEEWVFDMTITFNDALFLNDLDLQNAEGNIEYRNRCGCFELPPSISLVHNFAQDNILAKFLVRNNFTISRSLELRHNTVNDSWQNNLHYKGLSPTGENLESWDIVSELQCTRDVGGIVLGTNIWKMALQFFRKNLLTGQTQESRVVISVIPDTICVNFASKLDFQVIFDTNNKTAIINPAATLYQNTLFDNIGLFKNRAWFENPNLNLRIVQSALSPTRRSYIIPTNARGTNPPEPSPFYVNSNSATMIKSS